MRRYDPFLPTAGVEPIDLGVGWTPLVPMPSVAAGASGHTVEILLKNETVAPTWSWKDRLAALVVPHARAAGASRIATSSTGNHGAAIAAVAARADIDQTLVILSPAADPPQRRRVQAYGAHAVRLQAHEAVTTLLGELGDAGWFVAYDLPDRFTGQPYVFESYATIAYEIVEQSGGVPDIVVVPVGSGDGLYGIWTGFRRLRRAGITDTVPRMIAAEAAERQPLTRAIDGNADDVGIDPGPEPLSTSTMGTTAGNHALAAVRDSNGTAMAIDRDTMGVALRRAGGAGVFLEPASALAVAGAMAYDEAEPGATIVVVGTGSGLGWPETTRPVLGAVPTIDPTVAAVDELVNGSG